MRILLYSGGIDSLIAWYYLGKPQRLYVDLGTRYSRKEFDSLEEYSPNSGSVLYRAHKGWGRYETEDAWVPMRNMLLIMVAASEGADYIYLVAQKGEQSIPDRKPEFFTRVQTFVSEQHDRPIMVSPVFPDMDKVAMVHWYMSQGLPIRDLIKAFSCYSSDAPCGQCSACWRKFIALEANGIRCEQIFNHDIRAWGTEHYLPRMDEYSQERQEAMAKVMGWDIQ